MKSFVLHTGGIWPLIYLTFAWEFPVSFKIPFMGGLGIYTQTKQKSSLGVSLALG
jgi:hypothetical protein